MEDQWKTREDRRLRDEPAADLSVAQAAAAAGREAIELTVSPKSGLPAWPADAAGEVLQALQALLALLHESREEGSLASIAAAGPCALYLAGLQPPALRLMSVQPADLFGVTPATAAARSFAGLAADCADPGRLQASLAARPPAAAAGLLRLMEAFRKLPGPFRIEWASPGGDRMEITLTEADIRAVCARLEETAVSTARIAAAGTLTGFNAARKRFAYAADNGAAYTGKLSETLLKQLAGSGFAERLPLRAAAVLEAQITSRPLLGTERVAYTLTSLEEEKHVACADELQAALDAAEELGPRLRRSFYPDLEYAVPTIAEADYEELREMAAALEEIEVREGLPEPVDAADVSELGELLVPARPIGKLARCGEPLPDAEYESAGDHDDLAAQAARAQAADTWKRLARAAERDVGTLLQLLERVSGALREAL